MLPSTNTASNGILHQEPTFSVFKIKGHFFFKRLRGVKLNTYLNTKYYL